MYFLNAEIDPSLQLDPSLLKVGHGGTLDKDAEGILAIGVGEGCKQLTSFIRGPKVSKLIQIIQTSLSFYHQLNVMQVERKVAKELRFSFVIL